ERNRVHLAKLLRRGGNLLLLDEPTNDLDVGTLRALEQALLAFPGCAVVISHDRWFLDRVATHVLAFEGDSQVTWFEGNFEAYEDHRRATDDPAHPTADRPHRITYKRLVRGSAGESGARRRSAAGARARCLRPRHGRAPAKRLGIGERLRRRGLAPLARRPRAARRLSRSDDAARAERGRRRPRPRAPVADRALRARARARPGDDPHR